MTNTYHLKLLIKTLKGAIKIKNTAIIHDVFEEAKQIDLEAVSNALFCEYDQLVDQANELLMEAAA
jgi:hypothetical protein